MLLNGWRSAIGKGAVAVLKNHWDSDDDLANSEGRIAFSTWALQGPFNFVYKDPDAQVSSNVPIHFNFFTF